MPAAAVEQQYAAAAVRPTAAQRSPMLEQRGPAPLTLQPPMPAHPAQQLPIAAAAAMVDMPVPAVVDMLVAAVDMPVAADASNR